MGLRLRHLAFLAVSLLGVATACSAEDGDGDGEGDETMVDLGATTARDLGINEDVSVLVENPETLKALEAKGFDLGSRLARTPFANNVAFAASGEGAAITAAVEADVAEAQRANPGMPTFTPRWLRSKEASFQLVAVTNRLDRRHATPDACGEVHLVYRLGYANAKASSRLPMTLMLVYPQAKEGIAGFGGCAAVARRWVNAAGGETPLARATALADGPLRGTLGGTAPRAELNFQLVRWPSTTRQDMGGHAEYSLRVFERSGAALAPARMENSVRENLSPAEKTALSGWIGANIAGIDDGTAKLPAEFLATRASSVSPKGLARGQNRPFAVLFGKDGAGLPPVILSGLSLVESKAALLRRLDTMTCNGCHQSQGVAGFHALGTDPKETLAVNALADGMSPHLREQTAFRKTDLLAVAGGSNDLAPIPFAEHGSDAGGYGAVCGLGDPGFAKWKCKAGFVCSDVNGDQVGICVSEGSKRRAGEACEESKVSFLGDAKKDKVTPPAAFVCTSPKNRGACVKSGGNPGGFPNGTCTTGCTTMGQVEEGDSICGVGVVDGFNACIGAGRPFPDCVKNVNLRYRKACSAKAPCGPDYVCSAVDGAPPGVGACMPPYFIFQGRVDGHIVGN